MFCSRQTMGIWPENGAARLGFMYADYLGMLSLCIRDGTGTYRGQENGTDHYRYRSRQGEQKGAGECNGYLDRELHRHSDER